MDITIDELLKKIEQDKEIKRPMVICANCNAVIEDEDIICPFCGE